MEITFQGENSFIVKAGRVIVINPPAAAQGADIVLRSRRTKTARQLVNGPGEYEIGGALISTFVLGSHLSGILAHAINLEGASLLFLDQTVASWTEHHRQFIGDVDILLIDSSNVTAAQTVARTLAPRVVIPFGPNAAGVCAALGVTDAQPAARFTWTAGVKSPKAVLLKAPRSKKRAA